MRNIYQPSRSRGRFRFFWSASLMLASIALCLSCSPETELSAPAEKLVWQKYQIHSGFSTLTAVAGEFSGDDLPDVISNSDGKTHLFVAPDWKEIILDDDAERDCIHSEVMDVDDDGDMDWIGARYQPGLIFWLEQPAAPLSEPWTYHLVDDQVDGIHGLLTGDVDQDGKLDLLATSAQPQGPVPDSLVWLRVPEDPRSAPSWDRYVFAAGDAPGLSHYLGFGDVNGDGRPDAASAAKGGPSDSTGLGNWFAWWEAPEIRNSRGRSTVWAATNPVQPTSIQRM